MYVFIIYATKDNLIINITKIQRDTTVYFICKGSLSQKKKAGKKLLKWNYKYTRDKIICLYVCKLWNIVKMTMISDLSCLLKSRGCIRLTVLIIKKCSNLCQKDY